MTELFSHGKNPPLVINLIRFMSFEDAAKVIEGSGKGMLMGGVAGWTLGPPGALAGALAGAIGGALFELLYPIYQDMIDNDD